jgi:hypothetical protein
MTEQECSPEYDVKLHENGETARSHPLLASDPSAASPWLLRDPGMPMGIGRTNQRHNRQAAQQRPLLGNGDDVAACRQEAEG